uniref:NADH-ubiquinone oxidoreductase chain 2 n=1 Tax=Blanus cinereus TaxID=227091 RepID=A1C0T0_BLACI|nr:NADH dehydrogenase subunit 2 [Blanus cinereus]ABL11116.1 NADH dehydrogenase subunit 2 [Blanus cinereus]
MNPYILALMMSSVATGTIIVASTHHWLFAWIGLELNTLAILPLLAKTYTPRATEAATKYFLIQAAASSTLLFASSSNAWLTGQWSMTELTTQPAVTLLTMALMMKLGVAPLHTWLPEVMQGTSTNMALILATWQKLAPFTMLYITAHTLHTQTLLTLALTSTLIGGWGGLNQTQLRKMMAFSSIAHLGWTTAIITLNKDLALITLIIYITMTTTVFSTMSVLDTKSFKDATTTWTTTPTTTTILLLTLISLGGLPPLSGFAPKWFILNTLTYLALTALAVTLALTSLLSLMFYIRLTYITSLTLAPITSQMKLKWRLKPLQQTWRTTTTAALTTMLLPLTPLIITN